MIRIKNQLLIYDIDKKKKKFETFPKTFKKIEKIFKYFIVLSV